MSRILIATTLLLASGAAGAAALLPGDSQKGKALHDEKCQVCHSNMYDSSNPDGIYGREGRMVNSLGGLIKQVGNCNKMVQLGLDDQQLNDITLYLNERFYKFSD